MRNDFGMAMGMALEGSIPQKCVQQLKNSRTSLAWHWKIQQVEAEKTIETLRFHCFKLGNFIAKKRTRRQY